MLFHVLDILTSTQTYKPQNLNIYVKIHVESEFDVENCQLLRLEPKIDKNKKGTFFWESNAGRHCVGERGEEERRTAGPCLGRQKMKGTGGNLEKCFQEYHCVLKIASPEVRNKKE